MDGAADPASTPGITMHHGPTTVRVEPAAGGRIASILADSHELLVTGTMDDHPMMWGIFPMAPWAGRLRGGRFTLDGRAHEVADTWRDGPGRHALHGLVFDRPWQVQRREAYAVTMRCRLPWTLGGIVDATVHVRERGLTATLTVEPGNEPILAEVGWHPWFARPAHVRFRARERLVRDAEGLPTGEVTEPGTGPWDDTFILDEPACVEIRRDGPGPRGVSITSDASHWVVFDAIDHGVAVEPQSGPPDAFHLAPRRLEPGQRLARSMEIRWQSV